MSASVYQEYMPRMFPRVAMLHRGHARRVVRLLASQKDLPDGTSFAVTSDAYAAGHVNVWVSAASLQLLHDSGLLQSIGAAELFEQTRTPFPEE